MRVALVRHVPETFAECLRSEAPPVPIDVARARAQHAAYVGALRARFERVVELPADPRFPDCCFVEDTAVIVGARALVSRPGAPERRGEEVAVRPALEALGLACLAMSAPATLDGGDVLVLGDEIFVGRSRRTNAEGIAQLCAAFPERRVHEVLVARGLHLKSSVTAVGERTIVVATGAEAVAAAIARALPEIRALFVPDVRVANALWLGDDLLHLSGYPASREILARAGRRLVPIEASELEKADGGLTCLSLRVP
jgi:dimethylargininase